jgi:hypothetical protein
VIRVGKAPRTTLIAGFCQVTLFREKASNQARDRIMPRVRDNSRTQILPRFRRVAQPAGAPRSSFERESWVGG